MKNICLTYHTDVNIFTITLSIYKHILAEIDVIKFSFISEYI